MKRLGAIILVTSIIHIIICDLYMNFLIITPFLKAYSPYLRSTVNKQRLYSQIRDGEHPFNVTVKKILQTLINIIQLALLFIFKQATDKNLEVILRRMITMKCGDEQTDRSLDQIYYGFTFVQSWFILLIFSNIVGIVVDWFALDLSYGGTWNKMARRTTRILKCRSCKKKNKKS